MSGWMSETPADLSKLMRRNGYLCITHSSTDIVPPRSSTSLFVMESPNPIRQSPRRRRFRLFKRLKYALNFFRRHANARVQNLEF